MYEFKNIKFFNKYLGTLQEFQRFQFVDYINFSKEKLLKIHNITKITKNIPVFIQFFNRFKYYVFVCVIKNIKI